MDRYLDWANRLKPDKAKAIMLAKREISILVFDAVQLEGINFTLPEIQTLLDGITVGGHKLSDQRVATNQADAWRFLFELIQSDAFAVSERVACDIHAIAGKEEALESGCFRSGMVTIAGTEYLPPDAHRLPGLYKALAEDLRGIPDIYDRAIHVFLSMTRNQFFMMSINVWGAL